MFLLEGRKSVALIHKLAFCCFVKFELGFGVIETNLDLSGQVPLSSIVPLFFFYFSKKCALSHFYRVSIFQPIYVPIRDHQGALQIYFS